MLFVAPCSIPIRNAGTTNARKISRIQDEYMNMIMLATKSFSLYGVG